MPAKLTAQQSLMITGDCIRAVTGSTRPLNPIEPLVMYGVNSAQQASAVRHNVVANGSIGVPRFNFSLHPGFLATLSGSWTIRQLATTIRDNSVPNEPAMNFVAPPANSAEKLMAASAKFAEASALFAEAAAPPTKTAKKTKKKSGVK
ncbi:MAG TPA: hypothetical protein VFX97_00680 [Pyrinomonadaceae bacterium]|nr:hypothetical protein [Pyrinomonadaceae bacterium]